ncbi:MAG: hypothetical protein WBM17_14070 [Anaerolineales bacterium]
MPATNPLASHSSRLINQKRAGMRREGARGHDEPMSLVRVGFVIPA